MLFAGGVTSVAILILLVVHLSPSPLDTPIIVETIAQVEAVSGPVHIVSTTRRDRPSDHLLKAGDAVVRGSIIRTTSAASATVRLAHGGALWLDRGTLLRLDTANLMTLESGTVSTGPASTGPGSARAESSRAGSSSSGSTNPASTGGGVPGTDDEAPQEQAIDLRTPFGTIRELGPQVDVRVLASGVRVRVRDGVVRFQYRSGVYHLIEPGIELVVDPDGRVTRRPLSTGAALWELDRTRDASD